MIEKAWNLGDKQVTTTRDITKNTIPDEEVTFTIENLIKRTKELQELHIAFYAKYSNSDLDSCSLRLAQNVTQLKKIKNSLTED